MRSRELKSILHSRKLAPKKRFGQNFLVNRDIVERIISLAGVDRDDTIVELGVGLGSLTLPLAERVNRIIGLEIDSGIIRWHEEEKDLPDNVTLLHQDILKTDFHMLASESEKPLRIIANLPYSISNPLLFKLIECQEVMDWAVLMLQKEVADRLTAGPGSKDYGIISVLMSSCASVDKLMQIGPQNFHPRPKVDSSVVKICFRPKPARAVALPPFRPDIIARVVKAAFAQRRKTLINTLSTSPLINLDKATIRKALDAASISPQIRGEKLQIEEFVHLGNIMQKAGMI